MQAGLNVFHVDAPEHKELKDLERDVELLTGAKKLPKTLNTI
jgi:hypothetical protein